MEDKNLKANPGVYSQLVFDDDQDKDKQLPY